MCKCSTLSKKETEQLNECVRQVLMRNTALLKVPMLIIPLNIGKYATENGPARATGHFSVP